MSAAVVLLLSGPNLDQLGVRQPEIYGTSTLDDHVATAQAAAGEHGLELEHLQSASEAELVAAVHAALGRCAGIIVNAGALTHYGWSLHDALAGFDGPVVELHLSQTGQRESWRHDSVISPVADGVVQGFGGAGYALAVHGMAGLLNARDAPHTRPR